MSDEKNTRLKKEKQGYGYKYTELAQINEYLEEKGISYYQYVDRIDTDDYIMTVPIVEGKELSARRGVKIVDATLQGIKNPAQEQGSATTYARRYSLLMAFGLATEDDDGAGLTKNENKENKEIKATDKQVETINEIIKEKDKMLEFYKVEKVEDLTIQQASEVIKRRKANGNS